MRTATGAQGVLSTHLLWEPFQPSNDLQKTRSTLNEARYANCDPHVLTQGGHSRTRAGHAPCRKELHSSVEWLSKPEEAGDHERKALVDEHPTEAYRSSNNAQLHRIPTDNRHSHRPELGNLSVCTNNNKTKNKTTKENINLAGSKSGRDHSSTTIRLGEQNIHHWRPVGWQKTTLALTG
jgi:hypothetical protein